MAYTLSKLHARLLRAARLAAVAAALAWAAPAAAQLGVPRLPALPTVTLPVVTPLVNGVTTQGDATVLSALRMTQIHTLLSGNRRTLEADPAGEPMLRGQVVAVAPGAAALSAALAAGFTVSDDQTLSGVDLRIVTLAVPAGKSTRAALRELRARDPQGSYDFNHVYTQSGEAAGGSAQAAANAGSGADGAAAIPPASAVAAVRVGLIDGGVDSGHPVFRPAKLQAWGCAGQSIPSAHGTAVASLLVGDAPQFHGAAPGATLFAADVYCGLPTGGSVTAIAQALAWLSAQRVPVINISLVGPANAVLEQLVRRVVASGELLVAAVGNDGPAAPPLYPAAYPGVIGVTAVDAKSRVLFEAARGAQVAFAAPGADMVAAALNAGYVAVRGTSFAAPIVAGLLALRMDHPDNEAAQRALAALRAEALDLGARGPDTTYGQGLLGQSVRVPLATALNSGLNIK